MNHLTLSILLYIYHIRVSSKTMEIVQWSVSASITLLHHYGFILFGFWWGKLLWSFFLLIDPHSLHWVLHLVPSIGFPLGGCKANMCPGLRSQAFRVRKQNSFQNTILMKTQKFILLTGNINLSSIYTYVDWSRLSSHL